MSVAPALAPGVLVAGRYRLCDPVGSGGMGQVWRAYDVRGRGFVAVKVLAETHPAALLRLVAEQSLRLTHPHLVSVSGWAADDTGAAVAMPLVRGGSAADLLLRHGPLPPPFVAVLLDQLLAALEAVHRAGIVHRDVKPANLLLAATGRGYPSLHLADFGVAVHALRPRLTGGSGVVGTDGYMPSAQARGEPPAPWWDVYAAGVVAHELLTGSRDGPSGRWAVPRVGRWEELVATLTSNELDASAARALVREIGVPAPAGWPALGMPSVPDLLGPDPAPTRHERAFRWAGGGMSTGAYDAPGASYTPVDDPAARRPRALTMLVALALTLSVSALAVSVFVALGR
jgi:eukaryotic-like serine/threonine-protein kinase